MSETLMDRLENEARLWEPSPLTNLLREALRAIHARTGAAPATQEPLCERCNRNQARLCEGCHRFTEDDSTHERLNAVTRAVDAERRRWYVALESVGLSNLEGLAPEVVAARCARKATDSVAFSTSNRGEATSDAD